MRFWPMNSVVFAVVLGIAVAASHSVTRRDSADAAVNDICLTQECYDMASKINQSMDFSVNPCDNFYRYTCGNLLKKWVIPDDESELSEFYFINENVKKELKSLLEVDDNKDDIKPFKATKALYKSCVNEEAIEAKGVLPLKNFTQARGGWPVLEGDTWNESKFDWIATIAEWNREGSDNTCFMLIRIETDQKNSSRHIIVLDEPQWELNWHNLDKGFDNNTIVEAYYKYMVDVAVLLGAERKRAEVELNDAMLFQIELNKLIVAPEDATDPSKRYNKMTVKELAERYPSVKWGDTFRTMYSPPQTIGDDEPIIVRRPEFIKNAIELISKTSKRVQANFAMWQIMVPLLVTMNQDIRNVQNAYKTITQGTVKSLPRWKECITQVTEKLGLSLGAMYVRKFLPPKTKAIVEEMMEEIIQGYEANFDKVFFFDEATKAFATKKAKAIKTFAGYPKEIEDNGKLENYYRDLDEMVDDEYFLNTLNFWRFNLYQQVEELRKPVDKNDWATIGYYTPQVNAFAIPAINSVLITAGILQGNVYHPERPRAMNFASIGTFAAHEISHIFDVTGREYDENGDLKDWWTPVAKKAFDEQAKCFLYQYGNYTEETFNFKANGALTLNENIADNGGVKRAYHAYVDSLRDKGPDKRLPGLDFTPKQLYWIAYGNLWCTKSRKEYLEQWISTNVHSIAEHRVVGGLSNSEEFAEDFECRAGSKMNPAEKCIIW